MNALKPWSLSLLVVAAAFAAACTPVAWAAPPAHATPAHATHAHDEAGAAPKPRLDHGRKWATDAPLRDGMMRIRALVAPRVPAAHAGTIAPEDYAALAAKLDIEVAGIVANCKLPPQADAVLHGILSDLMAGSSAMAGRTPGADRAQGLVQVAAVNDYGRSFEHRGFKTIPTGH